MRPCAPSTRWTRRLLAWLIVCLGCAGMLPALAMPSMGGALGEICSASKGTAPAGMDADSGAPHQHHDCTLCAGSAAAAPPAAPLRFRLLAVNSGELILPAVLPRGEVFVALQQARAPPLRQA